MFHRSLTCVLVVAISLFTVGLQAAPAQSPIKVTLVSQPLAESLRELAAILNVNVVANPADVKGIQAPALNGTLTAQQAFEKLLAGTRLQAVFSNESTISVLPTPAAHAATERMSTQSRSEGSASMRLASAEQKQQSAAAEARPSEARSPQSADRSPDKSPAQDTESPGSQGIQEIIVTAQKRAERLIDVPISISALGEGVLKERGIEDFTDLSLAVPDLKIWDVGGAGNRGLFIRGVGNIRGTGSVVGMYIDEASIVTGSPLNQMDVRMYDLERVEVLRGPQGTLYGEGSMGGTVRFITKDPQFNRFVGKGEVSAAFMEDGDPSRRFKSAVNIPVVEDRLALRVAATYEDVGGWIEQPAIPRSDINDQEVMTVRVKGLWQPSEPLQVRAMAIVHRADTGAPNHGEDADGNYTAPFGSTVRSTTTNDYNVSVTRNTSRQARSGIAHERPQELAEDGAGCAAVRAGRRTADRYGPSGCGLACCHDGTTRGGF